MSQKYTQITPFIHLLTNDQPRAKTELEIVMTSGGSFFESDRNSGKKHLMEHCIASRTKEMDYKTFKDYQFANWNVPVGDGTRQVSVMVAKSSNTA